MERIYRKRKKKQLISLLVVLFNEKIKKSITKIIKSHRVKIKVYNKIYCNKIILKLKNIRMIKGGKINKLIVNKRFKINQR